MFSLQTIFSKFILLCKHIPVSVYHIHDIFVSKKTRLLWGHLQFLNSQSIEPYDNTLYTGIHIKMWCVFQYIYAQSHIISHY